MIILSKTDLVVLNIIENYLKKIYYLSSIENINRDYLEFGIFTGSLFCHSMRFRKAILKLNANCLKTKFYGFDTFSSFGIINEESKHPFYTDSIFGTRYSKVHKRVAKIGCNLPCWIGCRVIVASETKIN